MKQLLQRRTMVQIAWVALCAVVLRAFVPTGFMLGQDQAGHSKMVFCHGISMASDHAPADSSTPNKKSNHAQICSFAPSACPASLHSVTVLTAAVQSDAVLHVPCEGRLASESRVVRAQTSRGPPILV